MNALLTKATTRATARSSSGVLFGTVTSRTAKRSIYSYASSSSSSSLLSSSLPLWNEDTTTSPSSLSVSSLLSSSSSSPKFFLNAGNRRYMSTTKSNNDEDEKDDYDDDDTLEEEKEDGILYTSPMGNLISRLKIVSITSCVMSIIGLPCMIYIKNGDWPNAKQLGMGGIAFMGATGSTLALHFVFGPYILEMKEIPVRVCSSTSKEEEDEDDEATTTSTTSNQDTLLEATTRSVFGWKKRHVFDPTTDITPFVGIRPFANFVVKETTPLYVHPELLDEVSKKMLLSHLEIHNDDNDDNDNDDEDEDEDDDESVVVGDDNDDSDILEQKQKAKEAKKKRKKDEQDDDFLL